MLAPVVQDPTLNRPGVAMNASEMSPDQPQLHSALTTSLTSSYSLFHGVINLVTGKATANGYDARQQPWKPLGSTYHTWWCFGGGRLCGVLVAAVMMM